MVYTDIFALQVWRICKRVIICAFLACSLNCGQKGPLKLPEKPAQEPEQSGSFESGSFESGSFDSLGDGGG